MDFSQLTAAVDYSTVLLAMGGVAAAVVGLIVAIQGIKYVYRVVRTG